MYVRQYLREDQYNDKDDDKEKDTDKYFTNTIFSQDARQLPSLITNN